MKKSFLFVVVIVATMFFGCQKIEVLENDKNQDNVNLGTVSQNLTLADMPDVEVIDGVLSFKNQEDFDKAFLILSKISGNERLEWENAIGFISLKTIQSLVNEQLANASTLEDFENILNSNSDIVYLDESETVRNRVVLKSLSCISNFENIYIIENNIYKIVDNYIAKTNINNINEIRKIKNIEDLASTNENILSYKYIEFESKDDKYYQSAVGQTTDRKLEFYIRTSLTNPYPQTYKFYLLTAAIPYKKNIWGKWVSYKTHLAIHINELTVKIPNLLINNEWLWWQIIQNNLDWDTGTNDAEMLEGVYNLKTADFENVPPKHFFYHLRAAAYSRGIGANLPIEYDYVP